MDFLKRISVQTHTDERGDLSVIEGKDQIPFEIKRAFVTYAPTPHARRGGHANKRSSFAMINVSGACTVRVFNGAQTQTLRLTRPMEGVLLPAMTWKELYDYTPDSIVLFLSDRHYDKTDYIYDRDEFMQAIGKKEITCEAL